MNLEDFWTTFTFLVLAIVLLPHFFKHIPVSITALKMRKAKRKQLFLEMTQVRKLPSFYCHFKAKQIN
jgi:hypothetical protein